MRSCTEIKVSASALLGCDAGELAFMRNTTEGINIIAHGVTWKKGDEVILSTHEHVGNSMTWMALARSHGIVIRLFEPSTASAAENLDRIRKLTGPRTRLISIPHVVTTTGLVLPVKEICAFARSRGILNLVDGAQTAGMMPVQSARDRVRCLCDERTQVADGTERDRDCCMCARRCWTRSLRGSSARIRMAGMTS